MSESPQSPSYKEALNRALQTSPSQRVALVGGDVSGIQRHLGAAAARGMSGAARRLRFRSFLVLALSQIAAWELLGSEEDPEGIGARLINAGGHFIGVVPLEQATEARLRTVQATLDEESRRLTEGALRVHVAARPLRPEEHGDPRDAVRALNQELNAAKRRPLDQALRDEKGWKREPFRFPEHAGGEPCSECSLPRAREAGSRCWFCDLEWELGRDLAERVEWCARRKEGENRPGHGLIAGWKVRPMDSEHSACGPDELRGTELPMQIAELDLDLVAQAAPGSDLLAYLKLDGDRMGDLFRELGIEPYIDLSRRVDGFFREALLQYNARQQGREAPPVYLVYGGGDDLFCVAPWQIALDLSVHLNRRWPETLGSKSATLSGGIAIHQPGFPLAYAMEDANDALDRAKRHPEKNRLCLFGETLTWDEVADLGRLWPQLRAFVRPDEDTGELHLAEVPEVVRCSQPLPVGVLRVLGHFLPASPDQTDPLRKDLAPVVDQYRRRRARLLYALRRNAPPEQYPEFWRWLRPWAPFSPIREPGHWESRLKVLRLGVQLALWSLRPGRERE